MLSIRNAILIIFVVGFLIGCSKQDDWLDVKSKKSDVVPSTLTDFQAVLDNTLFNKYYPVAGLIGSDNIFINDNNINIVFQSESRLYHWALDIWQSSGSSDFGGPYVAIEYVNIVLDGLPKVDKNAENESSYNSIKGQALFYRAIMLYQLAQLFCPVYDSSSASTDMGLQIRTSSDPNSKVPRSSVRQTYEQIITDLAEAITLLPSKQQYTTRPSLPAAEALLSKVYLSMQFYTEAKAMALKSLGDYSTLLDYNSSLVIPGSTYRFPAYSKQGGNPEILFYAEGLLYLSVVPAPWGAGQVDATLYNMYDSNDLRKSLYFNDLGNGQIKYCGAYTGNDYTFCGIATDEVYLILAECLVREGDMQGSLSYLNTLLKNRYAEGTFKNVTASNVNEALSVILNERRKELAFAGQLRWEDLRRLNKDPRFAKTIKRQSLGNVYTLPPNDPRYVLPIPSDEIRLSNIPQNIR